MYKLTLYHLNGSHTVYHTNSFVLFLMATDDPYCVKYELFKQSTKGYVLAQEGRL